jgi:predicted porin
MVQIDGAMDAGYQAIDYKGHKVTGFNGNGSTTSQINFRGVSDLGGGLKADFRVENDWNTVSNNANTGVKKADGTVANGASWGNGEIRTGLAGGFGKVQFGAINNNSLIANLTGQPFGTAVGSAHGTLIKSSVDGATVRADNSAQYNTPVFYGFSGSYLQSNKQYDTTSKDFTSALGGYNQTGVKEISVAYQGNGVDARFTNHKTDNKNSMPAHNRTLNTLGANYAFGDAKVFLWSQTDKADDNSFNTAGTTISGTYTLGNLVLMAQVGSVKNKVAYNAGTTAATLQPVATSKLTAVGADYNLSKTVALYARYENIKDDANFVSGSNLAGLTAMNATRNRTALGLRVGF